MSASGTIECAVVERAAIDRPFAQRASSYVAHALHAPERTFRETNCYVDLVIELVHALGLEPLACLGFTLAAEHEGDQWTFFKPRACDLERLYGIRIEELSLFRPLLEHVRDQVAHKRVPLLEVDAFFLPDTAGSDYEQAHSKTTIGIAHVDTELRQLRYFHNAGFYELSGDDFDGILRPALVAQPGYLLPYCEIAKLDRCFALPLAELRARALALLVEHFARRPEHNPLRSYAHAFASHVPLVATAGLAAYHAYSFAGLRQLGACFDFSAQHLEWLARTAEETGDVQPSRDAALRDAAASFASLASTAKSAILKLARVANGGRIVDFAPTFESMAQDWERGVQCLGSALSP